MIKVLFICHGKISPTLKKTLKSTFFGTRTPSSTPFCTPNFLKIPDMTVPVLNVKNPEFRREKS